MSKNHVQITGTKIMRDISNMSLINTDENELQEYLNRRNYLKSQNKEINSMKEEIQDIKNDISEIKQLLIKNLKG